MMEVWRLALEEELPQYCETLQTVIYSYNLTDCKQHRLFVDRLQYFWLLVSFNDL